ncbi:hypothetical protein FK531_04770 [Rhodococcus spelaei]|uniref:Uncharacterized protein n=1 Tax=Rhodococcus spelaei TaxID=2546320 RepID=A0A541BNU0_9NOCA|nr:hypothetical protein [Rhodococcus spelaei]TQF73982.1 hypothetical protein FK531_04770 [Rhodococcus spelaei]
MKPDVNLTRQKTHRSAAEKPGGGQLSRTHAVEARIGELKTLDYEDFSNKHRPETATPPAQFESVPAALTEP